MKKFSDEDNLKIKDMFALALENHKKSNLIVAENIYQKILKINPKDEVVCFNLGLIFEKYKEFDKAKKFYQMATNIKPDYKGALNNLGLIFREIDDLISAKKCFEKVLQIDPNYINTIFNLGIVLRELGEFNKAIECYKKVIKAKPNFEKAYNNIGNVYKKLGESNKAIKNFEEVLKLNPNSIEAQVNIANTEISKLDDLDYAIKSSYRALKTYNVNSNFKNHQVPIYRLKHDVQQAEYLSFQNFKINGIKEFIKTGRQILKDNENNFEYLKKVILKEKEINSLIIYYRSHYIYEAPTIPKGALNPLKNWKRVEEQYFTSPKQIIYIDDFLSEEAADELRKFCLLSKIWVEERSNKYLGSFSDKGFVSQLHLQIANELKNKLPKLFGTHRLGRFWGFKYDSTLGKGINIHADFALVNLNFWITPDEFNKNKNGGGLKVYDTPAPQDWTFNKYNKNASEIYKLLEKNKASCTNITYKFNRAVLFNSDYFHETDKINFKDQYEGRRVNITYLFGDRLFKK